MKRWVWIVMGLGLVVVMVDLYGPWKADARNFDVEKTALLETEMWRAYYDKKPIEVGWLCVKLLRQQGFTPLRALLTASYAARAAQTFKVGRGRQEYVRALPTLRSYFSQVTRTAQLPGDPVKLAVLELEWWIIHRERGWAGEPALVRAVSATSAELYGVPLESLKVYGEQKARAMLERSEWGKDHPLTDEEWKKVQERLNKSYGSLRAAVSKSN